MTRIIYAQLLSALLCAAIHSEAQNTLPPVTLLTADFNDCALPEGWMVNLAGNGAPGWSITDKPLNANTNGFTIDGTCMVIIDDNKTGQFEPPLTTQFITPAFDATQHSTIILSVDVHFRQWQQSAFNIYVFNGSQNVLLKRFRGDAGQTGVNFSDHITFTADLSFYANPVMQLIFEYYDGGAWSMYAGFDNVLVQGTGEATNLLLEDFNGCSKPNGWDAFIVNGDRNWGFGYFVNDDTDTTSMNGSCFAWFDDDGSGNAWQNAPPSRAMLMTPWIDGTQFARYYLDFDAILYRLVNEEHLEIGVWNGASLRIARSYRMDLGGPFFENNIHQSVDLSLFRAPQFRIVFIYDDGKGWGWWTGIDNVKLSGEGLINDICNHAFDIQLNEPCLQGENLTAIYLGEQPGCVPPMGPGTGDQAVVNALWYRYHAEAGGLIKVVTNATFNDVISVFQGTCSSLASELCTNRDEFGFTGETMYFNTMAGQDYLIRVSGLRGAFGLERGSLCMEMQSATAVPFTPINDLCANAISLTVGGACVQGNNTNATFDAPVPGMNIRSRGDIWYRFTATVPEVEILSHAGFADVITLYQGSCSNPAEIASNEFGEKLIAKGLVPEQAYLVQISGLFATLEGNACVQVKPHEVTPPANDFCSAAIFLQPGQPCKLLNNLGATMDGPKPGCITSPMSNVWFKFIAPASGFVKINTGAEFPMVVAVYSGTCGNLHEVKCFNNPLPCEGYFPVTGLVPGKIYYLQIATTADFFQNGNGGNFCISILNGLSATPLPLDLQVEVECTDVGVATLHVEGSGGSGNYTFLGNSDGEILVTGQTFLVVLTDGSGCEKSVTGVVSCGPSDCSLTAAITTKPVTCFGFSDGSATVVLQGGTGTYTYLWNDPLAQKTATATGLNAGTYKVTVTDEAGCPAVVEATVSQPSFLKLGVDTGFHESTPGALDGMISITAKGGMPPYAYQWTQNGQPFSQDEDPGNLGGGSYAVVVTDAKGCIIASGIITIETLTGTSHPNAPNNFISLFPNPASGKITVRLRLKENRPVHFVLFDIAGKKMWETFPEMVKERDFQFDLTPLASGVYTLKVIAGAEVAVRKVVVGR